MSDIRIAIVGTGGIANRHAFAIQQNPHAQLEAVFDIDTEKCESFAARWGGKPYQALTDCLDAVDAVYVLTPPSVRRPYAVETMAAGKHLFCEKPLASSVEDGLAIRQAAEQANVISMCGFNMRYRVGFSRLCEAVHAGKLGTPYHFFRQRYGPGPGMTGAIADRNWRTDPNFVCGMTIESLSHDVDMLRWVMQDEVDTVSAIVHGTVADLPAFDNNAHVLFKMKGGASATITASWSSRIGFNNCGVLGETGTAFVSGSALGNNGIWCSREFHMKTDSDEYETIEMLQDDLDEASYSLETDNFVDAIRNGSKPLTSISDGYETLRVSMAMLEASEGGSVVKVK